ncbi:hypothetical protein P8452_01674 [Trifolium repens]|nr:hypothetical protein P8452_01674 [Trifolium repens]
MLFVEKNYVLGLVKVSLMIGDPERPPSQIFLSYLPPNIWLGSRRVPQTIRALLATVASWGIYHLEVERERLNKGCDLC